MGVSRAFVFLLGAVLGGGLLFALLYPRILALEGKVKGLSFRLEAQKAENRALQEEARRAQEELRRPEKMKPGLPPEGQGGGLGLGLSDSGVRAAVLDLTLQAHEVEAALFRKEEAREGRWAWQRPSWPLAAPFWVSSPFGQRLSPFGTGVEFHEGLDLAAPPGSPVLAVKEGLVEAAGPMGVYGSAGARFHLPATISTSASTAEACLWTLGPFLWRRRHGARTAFPAQETPRGG